MLDQIIVHPILTLKPQHLKGRHQIQESDLYQVPKTNTNSLKVHLEDKKELTNLMFPNKKLKIFAGMTQSPILLKNHEELKIIM
jgi:hypothetical protein